MTSSTDIDDLELVQLEQKALGYAAVITRIQCYFYDDIKDIQILQSNAKTEQQVKIILGKKASLLNATITYHEAERKMKNFSLAVMLILVSRLSVAVVMPVMINLGKESFSGTAAGFWIAVLGLHRFSTWFMTLRKIKVDMYVRLLKEYRANRSLVAV